MKVALYARVSTKDKEQNPETQLKPLREYAEKNNYEIYKEYVDFESGRNPEREHLIRLKEDAAKTRIDAVLVWKMDRLSRGGIRDTFNQIDYFRSLGISIISITEPFLSTNNPSAELILAVLAWAAEQESKNISARVKAGLERVKAEGQRLGRPAIPKLTERRILELARENPYLSLRELASQIPPYYTKRKCPRRVSHVSIRRVLQKYGVRLSTRNYSKK